MFKDSIWDSHSAGAWAPGLSNNCIFFRLSGSLLISENSHWAIKLHFLLIKDPPPPTQQSKPSVSVVGKIEFCWPRSHYCFSNLTMAHPELENLVSWPIDSLPQNFCTCASSCTCLWYFNLLYRGPKFHVFNPFENGGFVLYFLLLSAGATGELHRPKKAGMRREIPINIWLEYETHAGTSSRGGR